MDNVTPQETTTHEIGTVGTDKAGLSRPGSSTVGDGDSEGGWFASSADPGTMSLDRSVLFHAHSSAEEAVDDPIEVDETQ